MAGGGIEPPRRRAYEARKQQPVLQPAIYIIRLTGSTRLEQVSCEFGVRYASHYTNYL